MFTDFSIFLDQLSQQMTHEDHNQERYYDMLGDISITIVNFRIRHQMNQQELADFLGVSQPMVVKYEKGNHNFTLKTLNNLCGKLDLDLKLEITEKVTTEVDVIDRSADMAADAA